MPYASHEPLSVACAPPGKGDLPETKHIPVDKLQVRATPYRNGCFSIGPSSRGTPPCSWQNILATNDFARNKQLLAYLPIDSLGR